jgi:hypothetical protein
MFFFGKDKIQPAILVTVMALKRGELVSRTVREIYLTT